MVGLPGQQRLRVTLLFTVFEMGMPLVGFLGGGVVGRAVGDAADLAAIVILIGLGIYTLWPRQIENDEARVELLARTRGLASIGLGVSISLDELAIGFTIGLLRFPILLVILLIGIQTFVVVQLGLALGSRVGERIREGAERLAGIVLAALGFLLLVEKFRYFIS